MPQISREAQLSSLDKLVAYLRGRAISGVPISSVEAWDLSLIARQGAAEQSHLEVAEQLDLSYSQVQRRRAQYNAGRMVGDPDQPVLRRHSGAGTRPTRITLEADHVDNPCDFFLASAGSADAPHAGRSRPVSQDGNSTDPQGGSGGTRSAPATDRTDAGAAGAAGAPQEQRCQPPDDDHQLYRLRPAPAGSADRREDEAQAALVRAELIRMGLLDRKPVAPVAHLADAFGTLRALYASRDAAVQIVRAALCSGPPSKGDGGNPGRAKISRRGFPGYAFFLALKPRLAVRSTWWLNGVERGWNGVPDWTRQDLWCPALEPTDDLTLYPTDKMDCGTVHARWLAGEEAREALRAAAQANVDQGEIDCAWRQRQAVPGGLVRYAERIGRLPQDAQAILESAGADFRGTLARWIRAAEDGSDRALNILRRLDGMVQQPSVSAA